MRNIGAVLERIFTAENPEEEVIAEIRNKKNTKKELALIYADIIVNNAIASHNLNYKKIDFAVVNRAILRRYTLQGLSDIKEMAWKDIESLYKKG